MESISDTTHWYSPRKHWVCPLHSLAPTSVSVCDTTHSCSSQEPWDRLLRPSASTVESISGTTHLYSSWKHWVRRPRHSAWNAASIPDATRWRKRPETLFVLKKDFSIQAYDQNVIGVCVQLIILFNHGVIQGTERSTHTLSLLTFYKDEQAVASFPVRPHAFAFQLSLLKIGPKLITIRMVITKINYHTFWYTKISGQAGR